MLIGIDGGGTKTALCLAEKNGSIVSVHVGAGTNPADVGLEECGKRLEAQLDQLLASCGGRAAEIDSIYAGIAGSANRITTKGLYEILTRLLPNAKKVDNGSDAFNALYGESADGYGITLIAGTGSSSFVLTEEGITQVGGWGYLVDDAGSGFWVGKNALMAAYRDYDGRGEPTLLRKKCEEQLGILLSEAIPTIYAGGKHFIASFAKATFAAMQEGDRIASGIIESAAKELAHHLHACLAHVKKLPTVCVASGGLISNDTFFEMIKTAMGEDLQSIRMLRPGVPQVYGALCKAARNIGIAVTPEFRQSFLNDYK